MFSFVSTAITYIFIWKSELNYNFTYWDIIFFVLLTLHIYSGLNFFIDVLLKKNDYWTLLLRTIFFSTSKIPIIGLLINLQYFA
jgi:hypothetical protein